VDDYDRECRPARPADRGARAGRIQGYFGQPDVTAYTCNGWHHTGDVGRFDDEGWLYVGRKPERS
jgi:long-chain acyl-CoA synthetase